MASFNFTFQPGTPVEQMIGFELAGKIWGQYLADDVTINLHVATANNLAPTVIGGAIPVYTEVSVSDLQAALTAEAMSEEDVTAAASLGTDDAYTSLVNGTSQQGDRVTLTQANATVLGLTEASDPSEVDAGYIVLSDLAYSDYNWSYDYERTQPADPGSLDFLSVILHEIGHTLGFISGIDMTANSGDVVALLDLYRYSDASTAQNALELTNGEAAYFSIDGGKTAIAQLSGGIVPVFGGIEGYQASHWIQNGNNAETASAPSPQLQFLTKLFNLAIPATSEDGNYEFNELLANPNATSPLAGVVIDESGNGGSSLGIMDPTLAPGEESAISALDLLAFDVLGYTIATNQPVDYGRLLEQALASLEQELSEQELPANEDIVADSLNLDGEADIYERRRSRLSRYSTYSSSFWQELEASELTVDRSEELLSAIAAATDIYERRRSRLGRYSTYSSSFWQEEDLDLTTVNILSDGAGETTQLLIDDTDISNPVTTVQANAPDASLILRTINLQGTDANDLIIPAYDVFQGIDAGKGNNVVQLGQNGGVVTAGEGDDTVMALNGDTLVVAGAGDNTVVLVGERDGSSIHSVFTQDANDYITSTGADFAAITTRGGNDIVKVSSTTAFVDVGDGDNVVSLQTVRDVDLFAGSGNDQLQVVSSGAASVTTGDGADIVILGDRTAPFYVNNGIILTDFSAEDRLQLHGRPSDYTIADNELFYQGKLLARFTSGINFTLNSPQLSFVNQSTPPALDLSVVIPTVEEMLAAAQERYTQGSTPTYSIVGGDDAKLFSIDAKTGDLRFITRPTTSGTYQVTVQAEAEGNSDTQILSINFTADESTANRSEDTSEAEIAQAVEMSTTSTKQNIAIVNAGFEMASIGDRIWYDTNSNGIQDTGEDGVANVEVQLRRPDNQLISSVRTDANGSYAFTDLAPGDYRIDINEATLPSGFTFTQSKKGNNEAQDSDVINRGGWMDVTTLSPGENDTSWDAGIVEETPGIAIEKFVNGIDVTDLNNLPKIAAGSDVIFTYEVTNTGNVAFRQDQISVVDDHGTASDHSDDFTPTLIAASDVGDDGILSAGESWTYTSETFAAKSLNTIAAPEKIKFQLTGNSARSGSFGNVRTFSAGGVSVNARAFYYNYSNKIETAYLGAYSTGLGVTNSLERTTFTDYKLDNIQNPEYILFEFDQDVVFDRALLNSINTQYSTYQSNIFMAIADRNGASLSTADILNYGLFNTTEHQFLGTGGGQASSRWSDLNAKEVVGDTLLLKTGANINEYTIRTLDVTVPEKNIYGQDRNVAKVTADGVSDRDESGYVNSSKQESLSKEVVATLVGNSTIYEGGRGAYKIQLNRASDVDRYFTVNVADGTAKKTANLNAFRQDIIWGGGYFLDQVGSTFYDTIPDRSTLQPVRDAIGPDSTIWDYTVYDTSDRVDADGRFTIKVSAGETESESFFVNAWREKVAADISFGGNYLHWLNNGGRDAFKEIENENFFVTISGDADKFSTLSMRTDIVDKSEYFISNLVGGTSPIAFDLNGDGIQTLSLGQGVKFDMLNTGTAVSTGWLSGKDGFLAVDNDDDGMIASRDELFGGGIGDGFAKLKTFDSNGDGFVNTIDDRFGELKLWQDANENGITDSGELVRLATTGITDLATTYTNIFSTDNQGNIHGEHSSANRHGNTIDMVDVYFQVAL